MLTVMFVYCWIMGIWVYGLTQHDPCVKAGKLKHNYSKSEPVNFMLGSWVESNITTPLHINIFLLLLQKIQHKDSDSKETPVQKICSRSKMHPSPIHMYLFRD